MLNRELGADFDLDGFTYVPFWDPHLRRMDLRLRAETPMDVTIPGRRASTSTWPAGRRSGWRSPPSSPSTASARSSGAVAFDVVGTWTDAHDDFAVTLARKQDG